MTSTPRLPPSILTMIVAELATERDEHIDASLKAEPNSSLQSSNWIDMHRQPSIEWTRLFSDLRLVSRTFNEVVTPAAYEIMNISDAYMDDNSSKWIKKNIASSSRILQLPHEPEILYRQQTLGLLSQCKKLKHIQWRAADTSLGLWGSEPPKTSYLQSQELASDYLEIFLQVTPEAKAYRFGLSEEWLVISDLGTMSESLDRVYREFVSDFSEDEASEILDHFFYSKEIHMSPVSTDFPARVLDLLFLVGEHKYPTGYGASEVIFPPTRTLIVKCGGLSSQFDFIKSVDFAELRTLILVLNFTMPLVNIRDWDLYGRKKVLGKLLVTMTKLERLAITFVKNQYKMAPLDGIAGLGATLRKLSIRSRGRCDRQQPNVQDLVAILTACPKITDLTMDLYLEESTDCAKLLQQLPCFHQLQILILHSSIWPKSCTSRLDYDFNTAEGIMKTLHEEKQGVPFTMITIKLKESSSNDGKTRTFHSSMTPVGVYRQWGSKEIFEEGFEDSDDEELVASGSGAK
ncbi:uncharacterized protein LY89DRAFT_677816 [Mollisia scopiformis]|uniref:Uncharacterized protein n=1 Tax=Mollisia scopiformis TaxID=149040 RepID=A0A132B6U6_MOLSC|nr:uncharacterized protein LY89DRAFT_677816 [Mollisia scopiformis]KUJ07604.1 hypothetical protein LY89DRAFT_677816 [Mollisia scopiformis]